jgi:tartrate-resistant acid phosphatase type 5
MNNSLTRRRFLRQSFVFSALAGMGSLPSFAGFGKARPDAGAAQMLMVGDWGYENFTAQSRVAQAMQAYAHEHRLKTDALLMLGDTGMGRCRMG